MVSTEPSHAVVVGLDVGGTKTNATVLDETGTFLVDRMVEAPSCVNDGPLAAMVAIRRSMDLALEVSGVPFAAVRAVGLDTPGPATADGVISARGATNFSGPEWWGFDVRAAVEAHLQLPVIYNNDGNAAALYAHQRHFGTVAGNRSSVSAIVGTGLGGGVIESGEVVRGAAGMAGELGHVHIPMHGLLAEGQPLPRCNCGFEGDVESVASLSGIVNNLLPFWLSRYPDHPLHAVPSVMDAAKQVRGMAEQGDEMSLRIFEQQAMAIGRLFTIAANFTDPHAYFVGGGVIETAPHFRDWFLALVRQHTSLRVEQQAADFAIVADLDMAGARGSAMAALHAVRPLHRL